MKKAVLSLALLAAFSSAAVAAPINEGNIAVPTIPADALTGVSPANGAFSQVYFFNLQSNASSLSANFNWDPVGSSATGALYASNGSGQLIGPALGSFTQDGSRNLNLSYGAITAGYYAFAFTGTAVNSPSFSGQFSARVPAPAALGLVGLGLAGLGLFSRRRAA